MGFLWLRILGGVDRDDLKCCGAALSRARAKTFLPCRYDGVGLKSWDQAADFAWFTSVASCIALDDPDLDYARRFLGDRGRDAYDFAMDAVGGPSYLKDNKFELLPIGEPDVLSNSTFYHEFFKDFPRIKLQHEFLDVVCCRANSQFVKTMVHTDTSEKILLRSLKVPGRSILPNLFTANLAQRDVRLTKSEFVIVARQFTCLPPVKNDECDVITHPCGCEAQLCSNSKSPRRIYGPRQLRKSCKSLPSGCEGAQGNDFGGNIGESLQTGWRQPIEITYLLSSGEFFQKRRRIEAFSWESDDGTIYREDRTGDAVYGYYDEDGGTRTEYGAQVVA